jgi:hypothetical protein
MSSPQKCERYQRDIPESWNLGELERLFNNSITISEYKKRISGICGDIQQLRLPIHYDQDSFECLFDSLFVGRVLFIVFSDYPVSLSSYAMISEIIEENMNAIKACGTVLSIMGYEFSDVCGNMPYFNSNGATKMKFNIFEIVVEVDINRSFKMIEKRLYERHLDMKRAFFGESALFLERYNHKESKI